MDRKVSGLAASARTKPAQDKPPAKSVLRALAGSRTDPPPIWLMRQAGRYLPEYRELRRSAGSFLEFCLTPDLAVEATLQPIRRFGFDAAILFSDILVLPYALGQKVWFEEGRGPRLDAIKERADLDGLRTGALCERLRPVYAAVEHVRRKLPSGTALIGFAGGPWTVATYMLEGGSSRRFSVAKRWIAEQPREFASLMDLLVDGTVEHLKAQAAAGAEVLQIFESWAGALPAEAIGRWSLVPLSEIVGRVKSAYPEVPIILFPRGAGEVYLDFARRSGADALSLDPSVPLEWARDELQTRVAVQGNLDPRSLTAGGKRLDNEVRRILKVLGKGPFVFNLGHGILPETPLENVEQLVRTVRERQG